MILSGRADSVVAQKRGMQKKRTIEKRDLESDMFDQQLNLDLAFALFLRSNYIFNDFSYNRFECENCQVLRVIG